MCLTAFFKKIRHIIKLFALYQCRVRILVFNILVYNICIKVIPTVWGVKWWIKQFSENGSRKHELIKVLRKNSLQKKPI